MPLNFRVRMGSGAFDIVWPTAIAYPTLQLKNIKEIKYMKSLKTVKIKRIKIPS